MHAYIYKKGKFDLVEKPKSTLIKPTDAIVKVTLGSICTSDLHIKHGSVPHAVPGITLAHEIVGIVERFFTPKEIKTKIDVEQILNAIK